MNFKAILINQFAALMLNSATWERLLHLVERVEDPALSGPQKRELVIDEVGHIGLGIGGFLLNLGIELAVAYFKNKAEQEA